MVEVTYLGYTLPAVRIDDTTRRILKSHAGAEMQYSEKLKPPGMSLAARAILQAEQTLGKNNS
jgi:hypothetical protein